MDDDNGKKVNLKIKVVAWDGGKGGGDDSNYNKNKKFI
jgi:hypothetical protein